MPRFMQTNFTGGVATRLFDARVDNKLYANICRQLDNYVIYPQGPIAYRPGFRYIANAKNNTGDVRLASYKFNESQSYVFEFGNQYIRFYTEQGQVVGGRPLIVVASGEANMINTATGQIGGTFEVNEDVKIWNPTTRKFQTADLENDTITLLSGHTIGGGRNNAAVAFCHRLFAETNRRVYLIIEGDIDAPIADWESGVDPQLDNLKINVRRALKKLKRARIDCFLWQQGETDATAGSATYPADLADLLTKLRATTWMEATTPFVAGNLSDKYIGTGPYVALEALNSDGDDYTATADTVGLLTSSAGIYYRGSALYNLGYNKYWDAYATIPTAVTTYAAYEISSPYLEEDVANLSFLSTGDTIYIFHKDYAPRKLRRLDHDYWSLTTVNWRPPATKELGDDFDANLTLSAVSGSAITVTSDASIFQTGDVHRHITSGVGRLSITEFTSATEVTAEVIDTFSSTELESGNWIMGGSPSGTVTVNKAEPVGSIVTIQADVDQISETFTNLNTEPAKWIASGALGNNIWYLDNTATAYQATEPDRVYEKKSDGYPWIVLPPYTYDQIGHNPMVHGNIQSLGVGQWSYGDEDTLGYNTIYIRLADEADPTTKVSPDYIKCSTITAGAKALFRSTDVGKYLLILGGFVKITTYTDSNHIAGEIIKELAFVDEKDNTTYTTKDWILEVAAWSDDLGYPSTGMFHEERLWVAGSTEFPQTIWGSQIGDYENFTPGIDDSDAVEFTIGSREVDAITWLVSKKNLLVGTISAEHKFEGSNSEPITPLNVNRTQQTAYGSAKIQPIEVGHATLFVQEDARKIREYTFQWEQDSYDARDLSIIAENLTYGDIKQIAYQKSPMSIVWVLLETGEMRGFTYMKEHEVLGWFTVTTDGTVKSITTIPGLDRDELWIAVERDNGVFIEMLEPLWINQTDMTDCRFLDSGLSYSGAETDTLSGLTHLEGMTVGVIADGAVQSQKVVTGGEITLDRACTSAYIGLPYTGTMETVRLEAQLQAGTAQSRMKRITRLWLRLYKSLNAKVGRDASHLDIVHFRSSDNNMDAPVPMVTGDYPISFDGDHDPDSTLVVVQDSPMPLVISGIIAEATIL